MENNFKRVAESALPSADKVREEMGAKRSEFLETRLSLFLQEISTAIWDNAVRNQMSLKLTVPPGTGKAVVDLAVESLKDLGYQVSADYPISFDISISWEKKEEEKTDEQ